VEIEEKVSSILTALSKEFRGKYYPLSDMNEKDRKMLVDSHVLFKQGDRFLEAAGLNRDWPSGRGIYLNDDHSFIVWINEEDELRIIALEYDDHVASVFKRLSTVAAIIDKELKFAHDDRLGYLTSCPSNLGTGLRASVHVKLPFLSKKEKELHKLAERANLQIRGIHGEHSESVDSTYDISNKQRLGRSEVELV
jgi:creatine kinase/arginine kinase